MSRAKEDRKRYEEMVVKFRSLMQKEINEQWRASIFRFLSHQNDESLKTTSENHRQLEKLFERQNKPLWWRNEQSVRALDKI